jgi:hypothetical protein
MRYRVTRRLMYCRRWNDNTPVYVEPDTLVTHVPLDALGYWDKKGVISQMQEADRRGEKLVVFRYEDGVRTAVIGKDVSGASATVARWRR